MLEDSQGSGISLDEFCHLYAQYMSNGDEAEYKRIYNELTENEVTVIPDTVSPATDVEKLQSTSLSAKTPTGTQTTRASYYLTSVRASPPFKDINGNVIGQPLSQLYGRTVR